MRILLCTVLAAVSFQASAESSPWQALNNVISTKEAVEQTVQTAPAAVQQTTAAQAQNYAGLLSSLATTANTDTQKAEGGLGSLLSLAQGSLGANEFGQLSQAFPDTQKLLSMAPAVQQENSGLTSAVSSLLGGKADGAISTLDKASQVSQQFEALGLSADMIPQFVTLVQGYLQGQSSSGGIDYAALLQTGLGALGQ